MIKNIFDNEKMFRTIDKDKNDKLNKKINRFVKNPQLIRVSENSYVSKQQLNIDSKKYNKKNLGVNNKDNLLINLQKHQPKNNFNNNLFNLESVNNNQVNNKQVNDKQVNNLLTFKIVNNNKVNNEVNNTKNNNQNVRDCVDSIKIQIDPSIKKIHNIFKPCFSNNLSPTGFGDFIRGSYFLLQFCRNNNIDPDFHIIEHPISKYLKYFQTKNSSFVSSDVNKCSEINSILSIDTNNCILHSLDGSKILNFINFINSMKNYNGNIFINTYLFPKTPIIQHDINFIRNMIEPTEEILNDVNKKLNNLSLEKYNFAVIHVRMGDEYLLNNKNSLDLKNLQKIIDNINELPKNNYLLITDCSILKKYIIQFYSHLQLKFILNNITHTVDNITEEGVKNSLTDFYMMMYSNRIYSFSMYEHGSGFSQWCATTYDIPYSCKLLTR